MRSMNDTKYAVVGANGRIVIPAGIRKRLSIARGTKIAFMERNGQLFMQPITDVFIESKRGSLNKRNTPARLRRHRFSC